MNKLVSCIRDIFRKTDKKALLILSSTVVLLTLYIYHGKHGSFINFRQLFSKPEIYDLSSYVFEYLACFVLLFIVPLLLVKFVLKESPVKYGLKPGDMKFGVISTLIAIVVLIPFLYSGSLVPGMQATYPQARSVIGNFKLFAILEFYYLFYYIGWEFFFRGFMLFGLRDKFGALAAILLQTIPSCLMHIGKPEVETLGSIVAGIGFGYLALRTGSIIYPVIIHLFVGIFTDLLIMIRLS